MLSAPTASVSAWGWLLLGPALIAGFFIPGYLAFQRLNSPLPWLTSFIASGLLLFTGVLIINLTPLRLSLFSLGSFMVLAVLIGWRLRKPALTKLTMPSLIMNWANVRQECWWMLPAGISFLSLILHTYFEPLSGFDNFFRWNYLAQLMENQGSMAHYPPVTALDFRMYPWCDGIPPLVPIMNLWIYLSTGSKEAVLIIGRTLVELGLTLSLVWHLSQKLWGPTGARISILTLSTSTLFLWSMGIQQETGISGVAYLAMIALLLHYRETRLNSTAIWIGLAAAFGALSRDYNLILIPFALIGLTFAKASRRHILWAGTVAVLVAAPWYLRNAWITGNPLYPHEIGGLFPTNEVHVDYMHAIQESYSYSNASLSKSLFLGFVVGTGGLFLFALPGIVSGKFGARMISALGLISIALCLIAVPSTAGGPFYALRTLGPVLPLLAVAAGRWATFSPHSKIYFLGILLLPLSVDAARRSWIYPWFPDESPWNYTWSSWGQIAQFTETAQRDPIWPRLEKVAQGESIVVPHPNHHVLLARAGGHPIPMFSPEVEALTHGSDLHSFAESIKALRRQRVRFVILTDDGLQNTRFLQSKPVTRELLSIEPALRYNGLLIYDLVLIEHKL